MKIPTVIFCVLYLTASACISLAAMASAAQAQERQFTEEQIAEIEARIKATRARLQLTPEQEEQIAPILIENFKERVAVLQAYGFSRDVTPKLTFRQKLALRKELNAIRKNAEEHVETILSDRQMAEFRKIQDEMRERFRERLKNRRSQ